MVEKDDVYDVMIIGGGVCGTALLYTLSNYTNINKIALLEKNAEVALVNSKLSSNSQTLHFGDIETNYSLEKAKRVNRAAKMVKKYVMRHDLDLEIYTLYNKMVLAVGEVEIKSLKERYQVFKEVFPSLRMIDREQLADVEPNVVKGRDESVEMMALFTPEGYAIDFQKLSQSFVSRAVEAVGEGTDRAVEVMTGTKVTALKPEGLGYRVQTQDKTFFAKAVAVTSGAHSLLFAKSLGYGQDYALLSAAGSFYFAPNMLNGKVYRVQMEKLPFAAIHGDPEVHDESLTRFGPTAKVLPMLERHNYKTVYEYFKTAGLSWDAFSSFFAILSDLSVLWYMIVNFIYDIPVVGKLFFIRKVRTIVPSIKLRDLTFAKGYGGIRPQVVDLRVRKMEMGEAKILGQNILFNITPSPGASTCLQNAEDDTNRLIDFLDGKFEFDQKRFSQDLA